MLSWAVLFLVIALVAALFGFRGVAGTATSIAKTLFVIFVILFVVSLIFGGRGTGFIEMQHMAGLIRASVA